MKHIKLYEEQSKSNDNMTVIFQGEPWHGDGIRKLEVEGVEYTIDELFETPLQQFAFVEHNMILDVDGNVLVYDISDIPPKLGDDYDSFFYHVGQPWVRKDTRREMLDGYAFGYELGSGGFDMWYKIVDTDSIEKQRKDLEYQIENILKADKQKDIIDL